MCVLFMEVEKINKRDILLEIQISSIQSTIELGPILPTDFLTLNQMIR